MRLALGSDHRGRHLKDVLAQVVLGLGHEVQDVGSYDDAPSDYVDHAAAVAKLVMDGACTYGILVCGTGLGVSMAANRCKGIRAALCAHELTARMARAHNDANVLCLGARVTGEGLAESIVLTFLDTPFAGGRHRLRLDKLASLTERL